MNVTMSVEKLFAGFDVYNFKLYKHTVPHWKMIDEEGNHAIVRPIIKLNVARKGHYYYRPMICVFNKDYQHSYVTARVVHQLNLDYKDVKCVTTRISSKLKASLGIKTKKIRVQNFKPLIVASLEGLVRPMQKRLFKEFHEFKIADGWNEHRVDMILGREFAQEFQTEQRLKTNFHGFELHYTAHGYVMDGELPITRFEILAEKIRVKDKANGQAHYKEGAGMPRRRQEKLRRRDFEDDDQIDSEDE